jgi:hypothetical protein
LHWVTREDVRIGRIACTWLIRNHIDSEADIAYVPGPEIPALIEQGAIPFHVKGVEFDHRDSRTPFEAILIKYGLDDDPVLSFMGQVINGADTDNTLYGNAEGPGLKALSLGYRALHPGDDQAVLAAMAPVMEALHAYSQSISTRSSSPTTT